MTDFSHFVGIDWSGAKGTRHAGIAVAVSDRSTKLPRLILPPSGCPNWSREECADWIAGGCGLPSSSTILVGFDSSFSIPFMDETAYLPALDVQDAVSLWGCIDKMCGGTADLFAGPFVEAYADHYHRIGQKGQAYKRRMRVAETLAVETGLGPCESVFHLIGPSQVGMAGLSSVRLLERIKHHDHIAIWPFDEKETGRIVLVEIYAAAFTSMAGFRGKIRDRKMLKIALQNIGLKGRLTLKGDPSDHVADAMITAAGLRSIAGESKYWHPAGLSSMVRRTEGWIFGLK